MSVDGLSSTGSTSPRLGCPPVSHPFQSQDFPECILCSPSFLPSSLLPFFSHLSPNLNLFLWVRIIFEKLNLLISTIFLPTYLAIAPLNRAEKAQNYNQLCWLKYYLANNTYVVIFRNNSCYSWKVVRRGGGKEE